MEPNVWTPADRLAADIALIQMPYATVLLPSLGLGLLQAVLERESIGCDVFHFNQLFAGIVGREPYERFLGAGLPAEDLCGEWTFSSLVWGEDASRDELFRDQVVFGADPSHRKPMPAARIAELWDSAIAFRAAAASFIDACVQAVDWSRYRIVGFTTMFEQTLASVALATALRRRYPHLVVVFGGPNCEGDMGRALLQLFDVIDAVCLGEGEIAFPRFVRNVLLGQRGPVAGMALRQEHADATIRPPAAHAAERTDLETLPFVSFDPFLRQQQMCHGSVVRGTRLTFETSRGCWWGQKHHCTFCGLNGTSMAFRHKSASRAIAELRHLKDRYGDQATRLSATDNIIPYAYFADFLPRLSDLGLELDIFYETKANLRRDQLELYRKAGLRVIQPGIESLDTSILRLMRKGVTMLQNIQLLKWCREIGIKPMWGMLYGFPGENPDAYERQARLIPLLRHLNPPGGGGSVRFDRFSPYFSSPAEHGLSAMRPYPSYRLIYPAADPSLLQKLAYFFIADANGLVDTHEYTRRMRQAIEEWRDDADAVSLVRFEGVDVTTVVDLRDRVRIDVIVLHARAHAVLAACAGAASRDVLRSVGVAPGPEADPGNDGDDDDEELDDVLARLIELGLLVQEDHRYLSLPLSLGGSYRPSATVIERLRTAFHPQVGQEPLEVRRDLVRAEVGRRLERV